MMVPELYCLIKPASGACNMACRYCFYADEMAHREVRIFPRMSEATARNLIRKAYAFARRGVTFAFQGGEPMMAGLPFFRDFVALSQQLNPGLQVRYAIQTNGTLIDEPTAEFLAQHRFLVGVSLDGTVSLHDQFRRDHHGQKTGAKVLAAIELLRQKGAEVNILTVLTHQTARHIEQILDDYQARGFDFLQFIPCLDPMNEPRGQQAYSLSPDDFELYLKQSFDRWYRQIEAGQTPYNRYFENLLMMLMGQMPEACGMFGQCMKQYVFEADGSCYPCDFYVLDELKLGNVNEEDFDDFDRRRQQLGFIEQSRQVHPRCRQCRYGALCRGGCRRDRQRADQQIGLNYYCDSYRHFFDYALPRLIRLAQKLSQR